MYLVPDIPLQQGLIKWSRYLIVPIVLIAFLVLAGWQFDMIILRAPLHHTIAMNPVTALGLILSAFSFLFLTKKDVSKQSKATGMVLALLVLFIAVSKFLAVFSIVDIGLDRCLYTSLLTPPKADAMPSTMAPFTAACFLFTAITLLTINIETNKRVMPAQFTALIMGLIGLLSLLGYIYQSKAFTGMLDFTPMALHTAICFFLLSIAFLFSMADRGTMREFTSAYTGSITARSLIPAAVIVPAVIGLVRLYGNRLGLYSHEFGVAVFAIATTVVFIVLIWYNTVLLNRRDIAKSIAEAQLKKGMEQNAYLASLLESTSDAVYSTDRQFNIKSWNNAAVQLYGFAPDEAIGKNTLEVIRTQVSLEERESLREDLKRTGHNRSEFIHFKKDGTPLHLLVSTTVAKDPNGESYGYISICHDITQRKKLEQELQKTNAEIEAFTYSVSHDLRAPLRGIIGFTTILQEEYTDQLDDEAKRIANVIKSNALRMGELIDDLLNFSRLGRQDITKHTIDTTQMVNDTIAERKMSNSSEPANWLIHPLPDMQADLNTIRQVWINLIDNAVKYSRNNENSSVEIGAIEQHGQPIYFVKDNGVGFDQQYSNKLFKVFQRLHNSNEFEGTGVGLALVEKIIAKHGGKIWAEGEVNKGATFYFTV